MKKLTSKFSAIALLALAASLLTACDKDDAEQYVVSGNLTAASGVTTTASGKISGTYDATNNFLTYSINWKDLPGGAIASSVATNGSAIVGPGRASAADTVQFRVTPLLNVGVTAPSPVGLASGQVFISDAQEADLLAGRWFIRIATTANPTGELRGTITTQAKD